MPCSSTPSASYLIAHFELVADLEALRYSSRKKEEVGAAGWSKMVSRLAGQSGWRRAARGFVARPPHIEEMLDTFVRARAKRVVHKKEERVRVGQFEIPAEKSLDLRQRAVQAVSKGA